jgi:hypothetical protein
MADLPGFCRSESVRNGFGIRYVSRLAARANYIVGSAEDALQGTHRACRRDRPEKQAFTISICSAAQSAADSRNISRTNAASQCGEVSHATTQALFDGGITYRVPAFSCYIHPYERALDSLAAGIRGGR